MPDNRADQVLKLKQSIAWLEEQQTALGVDLSVSIQPWRELLAQLEPLAASISTQSGGVEVTAGTAIIGGDVVGRDKTVVYGNIYTGPPPKDHTEALAIYRRVVAQQCGHLPLRGVDVGSSDPTAAQKPLGLANVYVDLNTTSQVEVSQADQKKREREIALRGDRDARPLGALEATQANRQLVLLGDPGGGKSTFVNHLAHCLAMNALQPAAKWLEHLPNWPATEADLLPVVVILRDFARSLPEKLPRAEPSHLWNFIVKRLKAQNLAFAQKPIEQALEQGRAFILLDGLDEVPSATQRVLVREAVLAFIERYPRNRFLITCRVLSYQPPAAPNAPDLRLPHLPAFELAAFDDAQIDRFVAAWYVELARLGVVRAEDADGLTLQLKDAVRRADLQRLARNPLLLTVMALVHTHQGRLPDARALLYEETIDILLWRWEQLKHESPLRQLLLGAGRTEVDLKRVLWQLAFDAHAQSDGGDGEKLADIGELKLEKALAALKNDDRNWARLIIDAMKLRAGLLLERAPEVFTFPHRTFQEHLAGAHLAAQAGFARQACKLAEQGAHWREPILMAVGRLVYLAGDIDKPLALVGELCPTQISDDEAGWRKAWLAGEVLNEIGLNRVRDGALGRDLLTRVQGRLADLLKSGQLAPRERASGGNTLARLGDPRFRVEAWFLPAEPLLGFVEIPAGPFLMGSDPKRDPLAQKDEQPQHTVQLPRYFMARYPVTVAQWRAFVEASGFVPGDKDSLRGAANHPVVRVSWADALAYCDWLTKTLRSWRETPEPLATLLRREDWRVTLPTEAEWEKAARWDGVKKQPRVYPWGDAWDAAKCNTGESGIGATTPVGLYPDGISPSGLFDAAGNVWEWTTSIHKDYPYRFDDGREKIDESSWRVLRGGAFFNHRSGARCAFRDLNHPDLRGDVIGWRVVVSPGSRF